MRVNSCANSTIPNTTVCKTPDEISAYVKGVRNMYLCSIDVIDSAYYQPIF